MSPVDSQVGVCHISGDTRLEAMRTQVLELDLEAGEDCCLV